MSRRPPRWPVMWLRLSPALGVWSLAERWPRAQGPREGGGGLGKGLLSPGPPWFSPLPPHLPLPGSLGCRKHSLSGRWGLVLSSPTPPLSWPWVGIALFLCSPFLAASFPGLGSDVTSSPGPPTPVVYPSLPTHLVGVSICSCVGQGR